MTLLAIALVLTAGAVSVLCYVRSKSNGEDVSNARSIVAMTASFAISASLLLGGGGGLALIDLPETGLFAPTQLGHSAALGAMFGLVAFVSFRLVLMGLTPLLIRWSLRAPPEFEQTPGETLRFGLFTLAGFVLAFTLIFSLIHLAAPSGLALWLVPFFVSFIPLYETFALPWLRYARASALTPTNVPAVDAWLDKVCVARKTPRFSIRIQKGRYLNAFAIGGLGRHLIVIGGGLLDRLTTPQIHAIVAHEIAHVVRGDVPRLMLPSAVAGATLHAFSVVTVSHPLFATGHVAGVIAGGLAAGLFAGIFMIWIPGFFMRQMEFKADRLAAEMLGSGDDLAKALIRLNELAGKPLGWKTWSHPATQARVDALRALAP